MDRTAARQRILHRQPGQRHRHFAGVLPQVPHLSGGERHSRHPYFVRRHRPPGLSVSAEAGRDRHAERALPPGINDAGRCKRRTLKARSCACNTSPRGEDLSSVSAGSAAFLLLLQVTLLPLGGFCGLALLLTRDRLLIGLRQAVDIPHLVAQRAAFFWYSSGTLLSFGGAAWYSNPPAPAQSRRNTGPRRPTLAFSSINS